LIDITLSSYVVDYSPSPSTSASASSSEDGPSPSSIYSLTHNLWSVYGDGMFFSGLLLILTSSQSNSFKTQYGCSGGVGNSLFGCINDICNVGYVEEYDNQDGAEGANENKNSGQGDIELVSPPHLQSSPASVKSVPKHHAKKSEGSLSIGGSDFNNINVLYAQRSSIIPLPYVIEGRRLFSLLESFSSLIGPSLPLYPLTNTCLLDIDHLQNFNTDYRSELHINKNGYKKLLDEILGRNREKYGSDEDAFNNMLLGLTPPKRKDALNVSLSFKEDVVFPSLIDSAFSTEWEFSQKIFNLITPPEKPQKVKIVPPPVTKKGNEAPEPISIFDGDYDEYSDDEDS
jgi:hypothetical protein